MKIVDASFFLCVFFCFASCKHATVGDVERVSTSLRVVSADLVTSMPGTLLVYEEELVWEDATSGGDIYVIDRTNGANIKQIKLKGGGPDEVVTPQISWAPGRRLAVSDYNGSKQIFITLDELKENGDVKKEVVRLDKRFSGLKTIPLINNQNVYITPDSVHPFLIASDSIASSFGHYPLAEVEEIDNRFDVLQGEAAYNPYTGRLLHSIGQLSYMGLYKWNGRQFILEKEREFSKVDYSLSGRNLIIGDTPRYAPTAIAITKDYIVSIERDEERPSASPNSKQATNGGRRFSKAPHTVFVYDYDLNLLKIVDVGMPVFRIAADCRSNEVYLIGVNPDFCIATFKVHPKNR